VAQAAVHVFRNQRGAGCCYSTRRKAPLTRTWFRPLHPAESQRDRVDETIRCGTGVRGHPLQCRECRPGSNGLYASGLLEKRAKARDLTVEQYVSGNLLGEEVTPEDVANAFVSLALAPKTTGAVLPVDGGNAAAFPR